MTRVNTRQRALYSLLLISTLGILLQPALAFTCNTYELRDLEACDPEEFKEEAREWSASKLIYKKVITSECDGELLLGGYNVLGDESSSSGEYFHRTYKNLDIARHNMIYFTASFSLIDGWDAEDGISIFINEEKLDLQFYQKDFPCNKCGGPGNDLTDVYVVAKVPHNDKYVDIKIVSDSKKPCDTASFGFRDISILFVNVDPKDLECSICALADIPLTKDECPCPKGTFLSETKGSLTSWAGKKCLPASPKCVYGFGPTASDCYECQKGTFFDGECCTDCHPKCEECTGAGKDKCTKEKFKPCYKGFYFWKESEADDKCVRDCPEGWKCDKDKYGHDVCVHQCDLKCEENTWFEEILQCVCDCPSGWKTEIVNKVPTCVKVCRKHEFWWEEGCEGGACVDKCPEGWECAEDRLTGLDFCQRKCCDEEQDILFQGECVCECPDGWEVEKVNGVNVCSHACECGQYWWKEGSECGACVDKCPEGWKCDKGCEDVDICTPQCCAEDKENIWFQEKGECVCECPDGWETEMVNDVPVCAKSCDKGEFWWKGEGDCGSCVCECPKGWKCDQGCEGVDICTPQCCPEDEENIWFQETQQCLCECPQGWKTEKVNDVLICVHACEYGQFWWDDGDCGACVCECPEGWKCDKGAAGVDICVPQCCDDADENIWFQEKGECVCECPEGWRTEKMNEVDVCVKVCEKGQFFWQDGGKDGACVCECPAGWKCDQGCEGVDICTPQCCPEDEENIWFQETQQCLCECPQGWKTEKVNDVLICAHACECGQFWWEEGDNECGSCVSKCPDGWKCDKGCEGVDICVPQCCDDADENIWFQEKGECVCECPEGWKKEKLNDVDACVPSCECGQFFWQEGGECGACVDKCPEGWKCDKGCEGIDICTPQCCADDKENIWFEAKGECVCECPDGWEKEKVNDVLTCERACKEGQFWWEEGGKEGSCVCECPDGWKCDKGCEGVDICTPQCCAEDKENIWFEEKGECVCECPEGWRKEKVNDVPVCVRSCECGQFFWQEGGECGACVDKCPDGWKCDKGCEGVDICTPQCCADDKENIWFQEKGECVCECPEGWKKENVNDVPVCVKSCECGQFFWQDGGECGACVDKCPDGWKFDKGCEGVDICTPQCCADSDENIWFEEKGECVCECPAGWEKEKVNDVFVCKHVCEKDQFFWEDEGECGACVDKCPEGWKCDKGCEGVDICTPQCCADSDENIWFQEKGECVCQCPDGWEKQKVNDVDVCVKTCNDCQFWWKEGSECGACVDKCPEGWKCDKGCEGVDICTPQCCAEDKENIWFQEKGECVCECPEGWKKENVNEVPVCVKSCECGQFFWQEGGECGACVDKCPDGWKCDKGCEGVDICTPQCCADDKENIWFQEKGECVCECPSGWRSEKVNDVKMCVKSCDKGEFWWQECGPEGACVCDCPEGWKCDKGCEGVDICVPQCDARDNENIWFQEKKECVCECPEGWRTEKLNDVLVCVHVCDKGEFFWEKGGTSGACVCDCPVGWRSDKGCEGVDICVPNCDCNNEEKIWFEEEKNCVCNCPPGWEKEKINAVDVCRKGCYHGQFFWQEGGKYGVCVDNCPKGWHCGKDKDGLDICKPHCDENSKQKIWFQDKDKCVYKCPDGFEVEFVNKVPACVPCDK